VNYKTTVGKETREGTIFRGEIGSVFFGTIPVVIRMGPENQSLGTFFLKTSELFLTGELANEESIFDRALQKWLMEEKFLDSGIDNDNFLKELRTARRERLERVPPGELSLRFLPSVESTRANPVFILTSDRSDILGR